MDWSAYLKTSGSEKVYRRILPYLILTAVTLALSAPAWADGDKLDALIKDYGTIGRDLHKAQATQAALMKQKTALDARGADLSRRQAALNAQADSHNSAAAEQQRELAKSRSDCNNSNQNSSGQANECDNAIKKLNQKTADLNAGVAPLQAQQNQLDLEYGQYNQAANDWTEQENRNTTALNALYRALNDWSDRADGLMGSGPFMDEVEASHAGEACTHRNLPDGMLSIEELQHYAAGAERCLKYVAAQRKQAARTP